ncbi:MAG TPA: hypothetical protein VHE35_36855 [Kofleriaceae bacterium]|nr:hypothetical protein [Kofleriaceae bacterium]
MATDSHLTPEQLAGAAAHLRVRDSNRAFELRSSREVFWHLLVLLVAVVQFSDGAARLFHRDLRAQPLVAGAVAFAGIVAVACGLAMIVVGRRQRMVSQRFQRELMAARVEASRLESSISRLTETSTMAQVANRRAG